MLTLSNGHSFSVATAAGALAYGSGYWWERWGLIPLGIIRPGDFTIITKTLTAAPRKGNLRWWCPWRCVRLLPGGSAVNAVGLTNPGVEWWLRESYPREINKGRNLIVSIAPDTLDEAAWMSRQVEHARQVRGLEVNISCPNTPDLHQPNSDLPESLLGLPSRLDSLAIERAVRMVQAVVQNTTHPVGVKLGMNRLEELCQALDGEVAWIDVINTIPFGQVYHGEVSPLARYGLEGGVSGRVIQSRARHALVTVRALCRSTPVISGGGIDSLVEAVHRFWMGASAITLGTLFLTNPFKVGVIAQTVRELDRTNQLAGG